MKKQEKTEKTEKMHSVYVVFIITNTNMGRLIRFFTRNQYSHVSLSFDRDLRRMYSFARYYVNSPILGGFVTEHPGRYLIGGNDVNVKICKILVTKAELDRLRKEITYFKKYKREMIYNTLNAVLSLYRKRVAITNSYTCIDFITYLLQIQKVNSIRELEEIYDSCVIYDGSLRKISPPMRRNKDEFFVYRSTFGIIYDSIYHFSRIIRRMVNKTGSKQGKIQ